ncbi:hypothetical protein DVH24_023929 [Malus domestica]|uniref:Retrotransposon gag domain-containing protein n=1 Tax=Malus domestica TaxID=3750 RepID=A0A498JH77_MALDO|nr:hypothetical protein DVH24_023929 [Malus domestica]
MALYNHIDSLICKIFLSKLKGNAMKWYADIPYGSITDFRTLSDEFIKVFSAYKKVNHILVHSGVGVNLLYKDTLEHIGLLNDVTKSRFILMAVLGTLKLPVVVNPYNFMINFPILDASSQHNTAFTCRCGHLLSNDLIPHS